MHGLGIDACTAPSVATMTDWLASAYRVIGTYLGGDNWACDYGNFTSAWASQVAAEGWRYIPIWVGPQAPCTTIKGATVIDPSDAAGFWDLVNRQDWSICEQVQDGMGSRRFSVGYLAPMEQPSADIGRYVAARLDASGPSGEPGS